MHPISRSLVLVTTALALVVVGACDHSEPTAVEAADSPHAHASAHPADAEVQRQLDELRRATARFHDFDHAVKEEYHVQITPCWYHSDLGGMGYHYGNPSLIDGTVRLLKPEILMYEPGPAGQMRLVGLEYIVPIDAWEGEDPPILLGQEFHRADALGIYALHVWLWRQNPEGLFADWNPQVSCEHAEESEERSGA
jgi:hypothetical protein